MCSQLCHTHPDSRVLYFVALVTLRQNCSVSITPPSWPDKLFIAYIHDHPPKIPKRSRINSDQTNTGPGLVFRIVVTCNTIYKD